ncbi:hypothetical protein BDR04DRAFT_1165116 [Suillus decipiens]|nr:hypothetical protein BDR04DRAFT_1165116 [Suillus decipiens]
MTVTPDTMGLYHIYSTHPTLAPKANLTLQGVTNAPTLNGECMNLGVHSGLLSPEITSDQLFEAFTNPSAGILMAWQYTGINEKSSAEWDRLVHFLKDPLFRLEDLWTA